MRVATLNVQNLRLQQAGRRLQLHGAWDADSAESDELDPIDRKLTAQLVKELGADVLALQEVFDLQTLDHFHSEYLLPIGSSPYPFRVCLPGNDGRGFNVALLSRLPLDAVKSHAALLPADVGLDPPEGVDPDQPIFRRDCLMVRVGALTLFVCHFKSAYPDPAKAWETRRLEAMATRRLIERTFRSPRDDLWLVLGDLNEPSSSRTNDERAIAPLETNFAVDLMLRVPEPERWTYFDPLSGSYSCPDALLASPELAARFSKETPSIVRMGLGREARRFEGPRLSGVGKHRPHASDHAALAVNFPEL